MAEITKGKWEVTGEEGAFLIYTTLPNATVVLAESEAKANAYLISAAPDMLAALEMVVDRFYDFGTEESDLATVKAVIAKARGRESWQR